MKYLSFVLIILSWSCQMGPRIKNSDINPITNKFAGGYDNKPYRIRTNQPIGKQDSSTTAVALFDTSKLRKLDLDDFQIKFISNSQLRISYKDSSVFQPMILNGKFRRGFFEIYFKKQQIEIPPVVHFLFSSHDIQRLRIFETKAGDLIISWYYYNSGNFLLIGGEGPRRHLFYFQRQL